MTHLLILKTVLILETLEMTLWEALMANIKDGSKMALHPSPPPCTSTEAPPISHFAIHDDHACPSAVGFPDPPTHALVATPTRPQRPRGIIDETRHRLHRCGGPALQEHLDARDAFTSTQDAKDVPVHCIQFSHLLVGHP